MIIKRQSATADDLLAMPSDGYRYDLVEGVVRQMAPAGDQHGRTLVPFTAHLYSHVRAHRLGTVYGAETGFILARDPDTVLAPDVAFVSIARAAQVQVERGFGRGAPDLVVEVVSPSESAEEVEEKVELWLTSGVQMAIVVWPRTRTVTVYRPNNAPLHLAEDAVLAGEPVVPGWQLPVSQIFEQT